MRFAGDSAGAGMGSARAFFIIMQDRAVTSIDDGEKVE